MEDSWIDNYRKVLDFYNQKQRYPTVYDSVNMIQWILIQKCASKNKLLFSDQKKLLNKIPFWKKSNNENHFSNDLKWLDNFKLTERFVRKYRLLPDRKQIYKSKKIGVWFSNQKYKKSKLRWWQNKLLDSFE